MSINAIAENSARLGRSNLLESGGRVGGSEDGDFMSQLLKQLLAANDDKSGLSDLLGQLGAKSSGSACSSGGCGSSGGGANSGNGGACGSNGAQPSCGGCGCSGGAQNLASNLQFQ